MFRHWYLLFLALLFVCLPGCIQHGENPNEISESLNDTTRVRINYAKGFDVEYGNGFVKISTFSLPGNSFFADSVFIQTDSNIQLSGEAKIIRPNQDQMGCQSSTHLAFLEALHSLDRVTGLCGLTYVNSPTVRAVLKKNKAVELCLADQIQLEALFKSQADLFLTYPFGSGQTENYAEKGIQTLLIAEYLEKSQLARLEWIKLFGLLTGHAQEAVAYFNQVESEYLTLREEAVQTEKTFIMNLPFQDQWFMPAAQSVGVELIEDAGLRYFYPDENGTENKMHASEAVWNDGILADYWVIIASRPPGFSLADLILEEPVYGVFKSVQNKHVIFCNTAEVDYFAQGVVEPHILLKDLLYATEQINNHEPTYFFRLE